MDNGVVRNMTQDDVGSVCAIEHAVSANPWTKFIFSSCLERYDCWVMECDEQVIAFGILMLADDEAHILNIAIAKDYQHQGHGRHLMEHLLKEARIAKAKEVFLEVRTTNETALALYKKLGFKPIGFRKDYYQTDKGREDAQVLHREL